MIKSDGNGFEPRVKITRKRLVTRGLIQWPTGVTVLIQTHIQPETNIATFVSAFNTMTVSSAC